MNLIDPLLAQLRAGGPESPAVTELLERIKREDPGHAPTAESIVREWPAGKGRTGPSLVPQNWRMIVTVLVGGGGVAAALPWLQPILQSLKTSVPLPKVTSSLLLLIIVALVGAVAGAGYSIYCNRGLAIPSFEKKAGVLTLTQMGIFNEIFFGLLAAVTTVWFAAIGLPPPDAPAAAPPVSDAAAEPGGSLKPTAPAEPAAPAEPDTPAEPAAPAEPDTPAAAPASTDPAVPAGPPGAAGPTGTVGTTGTTEPSTSAEVSTPKAVNLLTYSVIFGAVIAGWFGSRMRSSRLNQSLLQEALAETSGQPATDSEELEDMIRTAPNAAMAAHLATGKEIVGVNPAVMRESPLSIGSVSKELWSLLDESAVEAVVKANQTPLKGHEHLLRLEMLRAMKSVDPVITQLLGDLKIADVAALTDDEFRTKASELGIREGLDKLLQMIRSSAAKAVATLKRLPDDWSWPT